MIPVKTSVFRHFSGYRVALESVHIGFNILGRRVAAQPVAVTGAVAKPGIGSVIGAGVIGSLTVGATVEVTVSGVSDAGEGQPGEPVSAVVS